MRSAVFHGRDDIQVDEIAEPVVESDSVLIDVTAAGICGSDLHEYAAGPIFIPGDAPHPVTGETAPISMGHEFGGEVIEIGEDVDDIAVGDTVTVNPILYCGECRYCEDGSYHLCESGGFVGLSGGGGGFSEQIAVSSEQAIPVPDDVPAEYAALVEPFSVGLHAVRNAAFSAGDSVAVYGTGPIGLTVVQAAKAAGANPVYAVEPQDARRELAAEVGADKTLDPIETDAPEAIIEQSNGGVDATFEVAGIEQTVRDAIRSAKSDGSVTIVSIFEEPIEIEPNEIVLGERTVSGTLAYEGGPKSDVEFGAVIDMFADGTLDPEPLITSRIDLNEIVDGFDTLLSGEHDEIKILVEP